MVGGEDLPGQTGDPRSAMRGTHPCEYERHPTPSWGWGAQGSPANACMTAEVTLTPNEPVERRSPSQSEGNIPMSTRRVAWLRVSRIRLAFTSSTDSTQRRASSGLLPN